VRQSLKDRLARRVVTPAALRYFQWRGDPVATMLTPEARADPYPVWADMRRRGRLFRSSTGLWATAVHDTASGILRDQRFSSSPTHQKGYQSLTTAFDAEVPELPGPETSLLTMDPPDHTRIRRLVASTFSPRTLAALDPWIRERAGALLDAVDPAGFDLIDALAYPLPIAVICQLLGVPAADRDRFKAWGQLIATTLEPVVDPVGDNKEGIAAELALRAYFEDLIRDRRDHPDDTLLSALIAAEEEGDRLSFDELVSTCVLLLVAGFETTVNLIGNGTRALIDAPKEWERLSSDPTMVAGAVEELLRYDSPVQATSRVATQDIEIEGTTLHEGDQVIVAIGGANRDPATFADPDTLDVGRPEANRHLSFSLGIHHCLGAGLARLEGRIAFEELTRRFPPLVLAGTPKPRGLLVLRGFEALPVQVGSAA
jgi:cytochrome P450